MKLIPGLCSESVNTLVTVSQKILFDLFFLYWKNKSVSEQCAIHFIVPNILILTPLELLKPLIMHVQYKLSVIVLWKIPRK